MKDTGEKYARFLAGEESGLDELIEEYYDKLASFLYAVTGSENVAEEAAEDVFVRLFIKRPRFKGDSSFKTWLFAIGKNRAKDILKKERKIEEISFEELGVTLESDEASPEQTVMFSETRRELLRAAKSMTEDQRTAFCLFCVEGFSLKETARVMGRSVKSVERLVARAREHVKNSPGFRKEDKK